MGQGRPGGAWWVGQLGRLKRIDEGLAEPSWGKENGSSPRPKGIGNLFFIFQIFYKIKLFWFKFKFKHLTTSADKNKIQKHYITQQNKQ
jgi:hypothetical protein